MMVRSLAVTLAVFWMMCLPPTSYGERVQFDFIANAVSANDMSPDGRYVVGESMQTGTYLWDAFANDMRILPPEGLSATAVSDDGTVVVGDVPVPGFPSVNNEAGRWTDAEGWVSLGHLPNAGMCPSLSDSYEVSADGTVVVGLSWDGCSGRGFRWTDDTGIQELQNLANGNNRASVVSADGTLIGGFAQGSFSRTPAIWDETLAGQLLDPPNGDALGEIHGMRDDGSLMLGTWLTTEPAGRATKWIDTPTGWQREMIASGSLLPGWQGIPLDIADDDTIVGFDILLGNRRAWIQPQGTGPLMELKAYVEAHGGTVPAGVILEVPQAISTDGRYIVGHGFGSGAWRITISSDCDFDTNGVCDIADLDDLVTEIAAMSHDPTFDLTDDGFVDLADRDAWLAQAGAENLPSGNAYLIGDADLNGNVDGSDFNLWNSHKFTSTAKWSQGDFNADGITDGSDFGLWNVNKFTSAAAVTAVPEPVTQMMAVVMLTVFSVAARRNRSRQQESLL